MENNKILMEENVRLKQQIAYQNKYLTDTSLLENSSTYKFEYIPAKNCK